MRSNSSRNFFVKILRAYFRRFTNMINCKQGNFVERLIHFFELIFLFVKDFRMQFDCLEVIGCNDMFC